MRGIRAALVGSSNPLHFLKNLGKPKSGSDSGKVGDIKGGLASLMDPKFRDVYLDSQPFASPKSGADLGARASHLASLMNQEAQNSLGLRIVKGRVFLRLRASYMMRNLRLAISDHRQRLDAFGDVVDWGEQEFKNGLEISLGMTSLEAASIELAKAHLQLYGRN